MTTAADGTFEYRLPSGPARKVTFSYSAFAGDAKPAATAAVRVFVRASLTLRPSPRVPRVGRSFRLSGTLRFLPRSGVQVAIQARDGRRWRTIDTVKTGADGRFSWPYAFKRSGAGRSFFFRARVDSPLYPFTAGNSATLRVSVRR